METLPPEEVNRIRPLLLEDEKRRDHNKFLYAYDILVRNWAFSFSIWPLPNADVVQIINNEVDYNDLPFEDQNEFEKGMLFEDLRQFVVQHMPGERMLCEAMNYVACLEEKCPLFRHKNTEAGGQYGICSEFKIAFKIVK